ncbi:cupin domain-containing protein [Wukongibacter sp. M2B1]
MNNMYSMYNRYPCPYYYVNTPMYYSNWGNQFNNPYFPFPHQIEYNSNFDFSQSGKSHDSIKLKDYGPEPFVVNIDKATKQNNNYRTALWTGDHLQVTLMSINVGDDIGLEVHPNVDQFIRIEEGQGLVQMGPRKNMLDYQKKVYDDFAIMVPAGTWHNVVNTGNKPLKVYVIYGPPNHPRGTIHETKAIAEASEA